MSLKNPMNWASWMVAVLGAWLIVAPWILQYRSAVAASEDLFLGFGVVLTALWSTNARDEAEPVPGLIAVVLGVWITVAPWILGYAAWLAIAAANDIFIGVLVIAFAITKVGSTRLTAGPRSRLP